MLLPSVSIEIDECGFSVVLDAGPRDRLQAFAELRGGVFAELRQPQPAAAAAAANEDLVSSDRAGAAPG